MNRAIFILSVVFIALTSCEKIINIDIPDTDRKIVINGLINPDSLVVINLTRSLSILEDNKFVYLEEATPRLFEDNNEVGTLKYAGSGYYYLPDFLPSSKSVYRIEVESPGLTSVVAESGLPETITFHDLDTTTLVDEWGSEEMRISFTLSDPAGEHNKYAIAVYATQRNFDWEKQEYADTLTTTPVYFSFIQGNGEGLQDRVMGDRSSVYFNNKMFLDDVLFNGKDFEIKLNLPKYSFYGADTVWLDVNLNHVAEPYYLYAVSSSKYRESNDNPFAEPVSVYTNVDKGLGIFTGYTSYSKRLRIINTGGK